MSVAGRLGYIDWLRGLCVVAMIMVHAYNGWLAPEAKRSAVYYWIRTSGGYPGAVFLFLAGLVLAMLLEGRRQHHVPSRRIVLEGLRRGAEVFGYAVLFRLWMFTTSGFGNVRDLLRVDVLNCIGVSMAAVAVLGFGWPRRGQRIAACVALAALVALSTPAGWQWAGPAWLPPSLLGYFNGRIPGSQFPLLPWGGFTAAGAAIGLVIAAARHTAWEQRIVTVIAWAGLALIPVAVALERWFPPSDFWRTSPQFFLQRVGVAMLMLGVAQVLSRPTGRSALRQLGATSLLVYWAHVEVVYGKLILPGWRYSVGMAEATIGFVLLTAVMVLLSTLRTRVQHRHREASTQAA